MNGVALALLFASSAVCDRGAAGQDPQNSGPGSGPGAGSGSGAPLEVPRDLPAGPTDPVREAVGRGLDWLARQTLTTEEGSLPGADPEHEAPIGVTALAALAFMAGGSTTTRGPHQRPLVRCLGYLLAHVTPAGERFAGYITDERDVDSRAHGHGLALLAMTQAYTLSPRSPRGRRLEAAIRAGVRRIEEAQGPDGGWYYEPLAVDLHEGSITVCLLQALRGARDAGFRVDRRVVDRAVEYVRSLQNEQGGFVYSKQQPVTSIALTGACLSTLHATGIYSGKEVDEGYRYVWQKLAIREEDQARGLFGSQSRFPFYERFYLAQALWQHRDTTHFRRWAEGQTRRVLVSQRPDGSWVDQRYDARGTRIEDRYGSAYATAMNVLYLQVPEGLLPIFQR